MHEERLGNLFMSFRVGAKERIFMAVCVAMIIAFIVLAYISYTALQPGFFIAFYIVGVIIFARFLVSLLRLSSAEVFENGVMIYQGAEVHELEFGEIKGIHIPGRYRRRMTVVKKDDAPPIIFSVPRFFSFAKIFNGAFTRFIVKDLTLENIQQANISFGDFLWLQNGSFIFQKYWEADRVILPLNEVAGIDVIPGFALHIKSRDPNKQILVTQKFGRSLLNMDALYYIIKLYDRR